MNCPRCDTRMAVVNSRTDNSAHTCYRRYRCPKCGKELLTTEAVTERYSTLSKLNKLQYQENKQRKLAKEAHKRAMTTERAIAFSGVAKGGII